MRFQIRYIGKCLKRTTSLNNSNSDYNSRAVTLESKIVFARSRAYFLSKSRFQVRDDSDDTNNNDRGGFQREKSSPRKTRQVRKGKKETEGNREKEIKIQRSFDYPREEAY